MPGPVICRHRWHPRLLCMDGNSEDKHQWVIRQPEDQATAPYIAISHVHPSKFDIQDLVIRLPKCFNTQFGSKLLECNLGGSEKGRNSVLQYAHAQSQICDGQCARSGLNARVLQPHGPARRDFREPPPRAPRPRPPKHGPDRHQFPFQVLI